MPNWNENELTITGDREQLQNFIKKAKGVNHEGKDTNLLLNNFVPLPEELKNTRSPSRNPKSARSQRLIKIYGCDNWWDWNIKNWGTKWDIDPDGLMFSLLKKKAIYDFDTAWSPPVKWLKKVSILFPKLTFKLKYEEPGIGFAGIATAKNGKFTDDCRNTLKGGE